MLIISCNITISYDNNFILFQVDVLLLASCFEYYRSMGIKEYNLDPVFYISSPSFSFDAMLLKTQVELELITDPTMYIFLELGLRGGVSCIFKRYVTSNDEQNNNYDERCDGQTLFFTGIIKLYILFSLSNKSINGGDIIPYHTKMVY